MMMEEEKQEITRCIHAHYIETSPYSSESVYIAVCNQCYMDYEIEGIEVYSWKDNDIRLKTKSRNVAQ